MTTNAGAGSIKALKLIEKMTYCADPMSLTEISTLLGVARSTAYSLVEALMSMGYLIKTTNKKYVISSRVYELGNAYKNRYPIIRLFQNYNFDFLKGIADSLKLTVLADSTRAVILYIYSPRNDLTQFPLGYAFPLNTSACGKLLLCYATDEVKEAFLSGFPRESRTPNTITTREAYEKEMALVWERGYAIDNEEFRLNQVCLAVPVIISRTTNEMGAISVSGERDKILENQEIILDNLKIMSEILSQ